MNKRYWFLLHWLQDCGGSIRDDLLEKHDRWTFEAMQRDYFVDFDHGVWFLTDRGIAVLRPLMEGER